MMVFFATINFGPPGPVQTIQYRDTQVSAQIRYRISHDRDFDSGEAAVSPSISSGSLTVVTNGKRRTIDFGSIFPIHEDRVSLRNGPQSCGAGKPIEHHGRYLAIQAILAEKGCAPVAAFVDLSSGIVATSVVVDHAWNHQFDIKPWKIVGRALRVVRTDTVTLAGVSFDSPEHAVPLPFVLTEVRAANGRTQLLAFEPYADGERPTALATGDVPSIGSTIVIGTSTAFDSPVQYLRGEQIIEFSAADEARYTARRTPVPAMRAQAARRNAWFYAAQDDVDHDRFEAAVHDWEMMLAYESDAQLRDAEAADIARCRVLTKLVRKGIVSAPTARVAFIQNGCRLPSPR